MFFCGDALVLRLEIDEWCNDVMMKSRVKPLLQERIFSSV